MNFKASLRGTVIYVVMVTLISFLAYFTIGGVTESGVMRLGGSEDAASLSNSFVSIVIGVVLGEYMQRWLLKHFKD